MALFTILAVTLPLYFAWAILQRHLFNLVFAFSLSLLWVLVTSISNETSFVWRNLMMMLAFFIIGFCITLLPPFQWLLFRSNSLGSRHRTGLEILPLSSEGNENVLNKFFRAESVPPLLNR